MAVKTGEWVPLALLNPELLLYILQCTAQPPTTKNHLASSVTIVKVEKPCLTNGITQDVSWLLLFTVISGKPIPVVACVTSTFILTAARYSLTHFFKGVSFSPDFHLKIFFKICRSFSKFHMFILCFAFWHLKKIKC